jgi:hypothetical protein
MPNTISVKQARINNQLYALLVEAAKADNRSITMEVKTIVEDWLQDNHPELLMTPDKQL